MITFLSIAIPLCILIWLLFKKLFKLIEYIIRFIYTSFRCIKLKKVFNHKYEYKRPFTDAEISYLWSHEEKRFDILFEWIFEDGIYKLKYKSFKTDKIDYSPRCYIKILQKDRYATDDEGNVMLPNIDILNLYFVVDYKDTIKIKYPCGNGVIKIVSEEVNRCAISSAKRQDIFVFRLNDFETFLELDPSEKSILWLEPRISARILDDSLKLKEQQEREEIERQKTLAKEKREREEREEREIRNRILARERKKAKEKAVYNQLLDEGLIYPDETNKRPPIPREVVDAVWRRDKGQCVYCGSKENLQLDHIIPFSKGGATTFENLQLLCQKCNLKKSNNIG